MKAWTSLGSRSNPNFGDGCALSHACAWGAEMASSLALSTVDAPSSKERKPAFSMAEDCLCLAKASNDAVVGGIERARCASLQNEAHTLRRAITDWGSHSLGRRDSNWLASFRFLSIKAVQKLWLPMGAPRISKSGVEQHKISGWNIERSC